MDHAARRHQGAIRNNAIVRQETRNGRTYAAASFAEPGRFTAVAYITPTVLSSASNRDSDPVMGDTAVVTTYTDIATKRREIPGQDRADPGGFPVLDLTVKEVQPNAPADILLPDAVKNATERVTPEKWRMACGSWAEARTQRRHRMKDYLIVVETP